jgi:diguanylate cyclase (GGDEF)-like protein/PAS domain S-box-containing protein
MLDIGLDVPTVLRTAAGRAALTLPSAAAQAQRTARLLQQVEAQLRERVKELEALYAASRLLADDRRSVDDVLRSVVGLMPAAWQHPEVTVARIELADREVATPGFRATPWTQSEEVCRGGERFGRLEVAYLRPCPAAAEGPFLREERSLLQALAQRIAEFLARRGTEAARAASEAYFRALTETATDLITLISSDGTIRYQSDSLQRVMGWRTEEIVGRSFFELVHPDDVAAVRRELQALAVTPAPDHRLEVRCLHADGTWRVLEAAGRNHLDNPAVRGIVVISRDTTARRAAEEALRASEERFSKLFDASPLAISLTRLEDDVVVEVNRAFLERVGMRREEVVGRSIFEIPMGVSPELSARLHAALEATGSVRDLELTASPPGLPPQILQRAAEVIDLDGTPCLLVVGQDVTARKEAERELRHRASHDPLTGLPNRVCFEEALERALAGAARRGGDLAVFFLDLDRFKVINDSLGHGVGDLLLREVACRLDSARRQGELLARFGGDELGGLLDHLDEPGQAAAAVERLLRTLDEPVIVDGHRLHVRASVGIAYCRRGADRGRDLLRHADVAMYRAKRRPDVAWEIYDVERDEDDSQLALLRDRDCAHARGHRFGRPAPEEEPTSPSKIGCDVAAVVQGANSPARSCLRSNPG